MEIIRKAKSLKESIDPLIEKGLSIGFVPTMGALHDGHLSLVEKAQADCAIVVVSIFVNPKQFNQQTDLANYPRKEEEDLLLLKQKECDYVFVPLEEEIYPENFKAVAVQLGSLESTMEGRHRQGHFQGVVNVVARLFDIIRPTNAYFGKKDFQQIAVIKTMTQQLGYSVEICEGETYRERNGLAMSSRNLLLSEAQKQDATIIFKTLSLGKKLAQNHSPKETLTQMNIFFDKGYLTREYILIVHPDTLETLQGTWVKGAMACIAATCGKVRLIDNMQLIAR